MIDRVTKNIINIMNPYTEIIYPFNISYGILSSIVLIIAFYFQYNYKKMLEKGIQP